MMQMRIADATAFEYNGPSDGACEICGTRDGTFELTDARDGARRVLCASCASRLSRRAVFFAADDFGVGPSADAHRRKKR